MRVQDFTVSDNLTTSANAANFVFVGLFSVASRGVIRDNFVTGVGCGSCVGPAL